MCLGQHDQRMAQHPLHKMQTPRQLLADIRNAVPYRFPGPKSLERINGSLADKAAAELGWWDIITSAKQLQLSKHPSTQEFIDYYTLCLAAHHSTVASFVPTDVDTKIRRHIWRYASAPGIIDKMCAIFMHAVETWDRQTVSARSISDAIDGPISGLDGEWLSVAIPAMLAADKHGLSERAEALWQWIEQEVQRQARIFQRSLQDEDHVRMLKLAAILCHNAGDIDQGIDSNAAGPQYHQRLQSIAGLAKIKEEDSDSRFNGLFFIAAQIYKHCMAKEFHRHYPLREMKILREHQDFAFPISPFLEDWGALLAQHTYFNEEQRIEVLGGLIHACDVVNNQDGYQRAIHGFLNNDEREELISHLPVNLSQRLRQDDLARHLDLSAEDFAAEKTKDLFDLVPELNPDRIQYYLKDK